MPVSPKSVLCKEFEDNVSREQ